MTIFGDGYEEVIRRLVGGLQFMRAWRQEWSVPTTGAISQARERLGEAPLKALFEKIAEPVATAGMPGSWLGSRRLMAIDGVGKLNVPETPTNAVGFPRPGALDKRPYSQVQVVGLAECGTHAVVAAEIGTLRARVSGNSRRSSLPHWNQECSSLPTEGSSASSSRAEFMATGAICCSGSRPS